MRPAISWLFSRSHHPPRAYLEAEEGVQAAETEDEARDRLPGSSSSFSFGSLARHFITPTDNNCVSALINSYVRDIVRRRIEEGHFTQNLFNPACVVVLEVMERE